MSFLSVSSAVSTVQNVVASLASKDNKASSVSFADLLSEAAPAPVEKPAVAAALANPLLTTPEQSKAARPDLWTFIEKTGAKMEDAIEFLYGTVGSNTDTRDWNAILTSADPVTTVRQATRAMYMDVDRVVDEDALPDPKNILDQAGNFALHQVKDAEGNVISNSVALLDGRGRMIRDAGTTEQSINRNAWLFGFDTAPMANLKATASKISEQFYNLIDKIAA